MHKVKVIVPKADPLGSDTQVLLDDVDITRSVSAVVVQVLATQQTEVRLTLVDVEVEIETDQAHCIVTPIGDNGEYWGEMECIEIHRVALEEMELGAEGEGA